MTVALIYHDVVPRDRAEQSGFAGATAARYKLHPERFSQHLDAFTAAGLSVGLLADRPDLALTFDDGGSSALLIAELLERRGWRGHFFVTTGRIGSDGFLDRDGVRELVRRGHEVGSHSESHPAYMGALSATELAREWRASREALAEILGEPPATAAVPGGFVSDAVFGEAARAGYSLLWTSNPASSPRRREGLEVRGRYTIWARTAPARAAGYARGDIVARSTMWLAWQAKNLPKRLSPSTYERVRERWADWRTLQ